VHEHELHAERGEQVQVVGEIEEPPVGDQIAAECDDKDLAAECVDVRRDRLEPVDEPILAGKALPARRLGAFRRAVIPRWRVLFDRNGSAPARASRAART
jgi:hypothetical protein